MEEREVTLTKREIEILLLLVTGLTAKEIGGKLNISHNTVKSTRRGMMLKYRVKTIGHLIVKTTDIWYK